MSVRVIRLVNGEELIGELELVKKSDHHNDYKLSKVGVVSLVPTQTGVGISLYPFAPYSDDDSFIFRYEHVVTSFSPSVDLLNNYNKMFGSGIQIASAGSLIK